MLQNVINQSHHDMYLLGFVVIQSLKCTCPLLHQIHPITWKHLLTYMSMEDLEDIKQKYLIITVDTMFVLENGRQLQECILQYDKIPICVNILKKF